MNCRVCFISFHFALRSDIASIFPSAISTCTYLPSLLNSYCLYTILIPLFLLLFLSFFRHPVVLPFLSLFALLIDLVLRPCTSLCVCVCARADNIPGLYHGRSKWFLPGTLHRISCSPPLFPPHTHTSSMCLLCHARCSAACTVFKCCLSRSPRICYVLERR